VLGGLLIGLGITVALRWAIEIIDEY
jgi:hypothetical protein